MPLSDFNFTADEESTLVQKQFANALANLIEHAHQDCTRLITWHWTKAANEKPSACQIAGLEHILTLQRLSGPIYVRTDSPGDLRETVGSVKSVVMPF